MIFFSFNFPCDLTTCRLGDFDVVFMTQFLRSNTNNVWPQGPPPPKKKKSVCAFDLLLVSATVHCRRSEFLILGLFDSHLLVRNSMGSDK
jgi:hypothetical protein